jgi:hypothetical protein
MSTRKLLTQSAEHMPGLLTASCLLQGNCSAATGLLVLRHSSVAHVLMAGAAMTHSCIAELDGWRGGVQPCAQAGICWCTLGRTMAVAASQNNQQPVQTL